MSQIGDELDGDAAFGEFEAAWDSHTAAAAAGVAPATSLLVPQPQIQFEQHQQPTTQQQQQEESSASALFFSKFASVTEDTGHLICTSAQWQKSALTSPISFLPVVC